MTEEFKSVISEWNTHGYRLQKGPLLPSSYLKPIDKKIEFLREISEEVLSNEERYSYYQEMKFLMMEKKHFYMNHRNWITAQEFQNEIEKYDFAMSKLNPFLADYDFLEKETKVIHKLLSEQDQIPLNFLKFQIRTIFLGVPLEIKVSLETINIYCSKNINVTSQVEILKDFVEPYKFKVKWDKEMNLISIAF